LENGIGITKNAEEAEDITDVGGAYGMGVELRETANKRFNI
jgi:hypothetical protein